MNANDICFSVVTKIICVLALIVMVLSVHACSTETGKNEIGTTMGHVASIYVRLPNGKQVVCVTWDPGEGGGLSCDWNHVE